MGTIIQQQYAQPQIHDVGLAVSASGMTITVSAGAFRVQGTAYTLAAPSSLTLDPDPTYARAAIGYLALDALGHPVVVVDELSKEFPGVVFDWADYKMLWRLFILPIPAGTTALDGLELTCFCTVVSE